VRPGKIGDFDIHRTNYAQPEINADKRGSGSNGRLRRERETL
jgi:hypothetical protein